MFDFVTMPGIVSWVSDETRAQIVRFLAPYLKPGGVVQISYNAMAACAAGTAAAAPAHARTRKIAARTGRVPPRSRSNSSSTVRSISCATRMRPPASFRSRAPIRAISCTSTCTSSGRRSTSRTSRRNSPTPSSCFAGSAPYVFMSPVAWLTNEQNEVMNSITDPLFAEEVRDYFCNRSFRSDIFRARQGGVERRAPARAREACASVGQSEGRIPAGDQARICRR